MKKFLPKTKNNSSGFTLIELMVVISIIAILSVIGMTVYTGVQKNSRDARRKADIDSIAIALESDFATNNRTAYIAPVGTMFSGGIVPLDPTNTTTYVYTTTVVAGPPSTFCSCADLEGATGNSSSNACVAVAAGTGGFYCRKNQQ